MSQDNASDELAGLRLLLVDDDAMVRRVMTRATSDWGMLVDAVDSGAHALDQLNIADYDMIITDLKMPGVSGLELLQHVVSAHSHVPVLVVTGFAEPDAEAAVAEAGAGLLRKPFSPEELRAALHWCHRRTRPRASRG